MRVNLIIAMSPNRCFVLQRAAFFERFEPLGLCLVLRTKRSTSCQFWWNALSFENGMVSQFEWNQ